MLRFIKIVLITTIALLVLGVVLFQAMDAPQRTESKVIPNERLRR